MKLKLVTKKGLLRIAILLGLLAIVGGSLCWVMFHMPGKSFDGTLPPLSAEEVTLRERLGTHLKKLASEIGERNCLFPAKLEAAASYIEAELRSLGLTAGAERGGRFEAVDQDIPGKVPCRNICAELPGTDPALAMIVVGAHYDSVMGSPGANDNGTGTVALLEIARILKSRAFRRTVRFVAFTNEEPPFFKTANMGSLVHARASKARGDRIEAMISLETLGCYSNAPKSQKYPPPLDRLYPDTGNFVGFVGNLSGRALLKDAIRVFRETTSFGPVTK